MKRSKIGQKGDSKNFSTTPRQPFDYPPVTSPDAKLLVQSFCSELYALLIWSGVPFFLSYLSFDMLWRCFCPNGFFLKTSIILWHIFDSILKITFENNFSRQYWIQNNILSIRARSEEEFPKFSESLKIFPCNKVHACNLKIHNSLVIIHQLNSLRRLIEIKFKTSWMNNLDDTVNIYVIPQDISVSI